MLPGTTMPVHRVRCPCGAKLALKTYWKKPLCKACRAEARRARGYDPERKVREEARRYRILLAVGPYETFEEMYRALAIRSPRTREARYDMTIYQRGCRG